MEDIMEETTNILKEVRLEEFKELLMQFLLENNILFQYLENLNHYNVIGAKTLEGVFLSLEQSIVVYPENVFMDIIIYSFCWSDTKEGWNYWTNIDDSFHVYFEQSTFNNKYFNVKL